MTVPPPFDQSADSQEQGRWSEYHTQDKGEVPPRPYLVLDRLKPVEVHRFHPSSSASPHWPNQMPSKKAMPIAVNKTASMFSTRSFVFGGGSGSLTTDLA
jgi:hypothetical protein